MIKHALGAVAGLALAGSLAVAALPSGAADHLDAPAVKKDGRTDLTDIYAFQSKEHPGNTVLIMDVNPLAGVVSGTRSIRRAPTSSWSTTTETHAPTSRSRPPSTTPATEQRVKVKRGHQPSATRRPARPSRCGAAGRPGPGWPTTRSSSTSKPSVTR